MKAKKKLAVLLLAVCSISAFAGACKVQAGSTKKYVSISKTNFPDKYFRKHVKRYDKNKDNRFSAKEIKAVTYMNLDPEAYDKVSLEAYGTVASIKSVKGLGYFTNLKKFRIDNLPVENITICSPGLETVYIDGDLKKLNLSKCKKLEKLRVNSDSQILLDLGQFKELEEVVFGSGTGRCWDVECDKLNLKKCKKLGALTIGPIKESDVIDLTMFPNLVNVNLYGKVEKVDVHGLKKLEELVCNTTGLKEINVRNCTGLKVLDIRHNPIETLDLTTNVKLKALYCIVTNLKSLDCTNNTKLNDIWCDEGTALNGVDPATTKIRRWKAD